MLSAMSHHPLALDRTIFLRAACSPARSTDPRPVRSGAVDFLDRSMAILATAVAAASFPTSGLPGTIMARYAPP